MIAKLERTVFFLLVFFLPTQLGKHFWPSFAFISGIRIDYLSPTLYFTDILIILLFLLFLMGRLQLKKIRFPSFSFNYVLVSAFILLISVNVSQAKVQEAALYSFAKILEYLFLGFYIAFKFKQKDIKTFIDTLSLSMIPISILGIWQFLKQSSIGGIFYYFGERTFSGITPGIANMDIKGILFLRPYATFPHPNVFAFFLFFAGVFILNSLVYEKDRSKRIFDTMLLILTSISILLTFSRILILLYLITFLFIFFTRLIKSKAVVFFVSAFLFLILLVIYFSNFLSRFIDQKLIIRDLLWRQGLIDVSLKMLKESPIIGVGMNNFFYYEALYQKIINPVFLQPVHNIFLLTLAQLGVIGLFVLVFFLVKSFVRLVINYREASNKENKSFYFALILIFISFVLSSLFDHYFLTLQQAQLLLTMILGFCFVNLNKGNRNA